MSYENGANYSIVRFFLDIEVCPVQIRQIIYSQLELKATDIVIQSLLK